MYLPRNPSHEIFSLNRCLVHPSAVLVGLALFMQFTLHHSAWCFVEGEVNSYLVAALITEDKLIILKCKQPDYAAQDQTIAFIANDCWLHALKYFCGRECFFLFQCLSLGVSQRTK